MKKLFFFAGFLISNWCMGQIYVNHKNLSTSTEQYVEVWEKYNSASGKFYAMVDYGQDILEEEGGARLKIHDPNKNFLQFNNTIAILNFLHRNGWELIQIKKTANIESYLMQRRKEFMPSPNREHVNTTIGSVD
jgi:hypothetical protein